MTSANQLVPLLHLPCFLPLITNYTVSIGTAVRRYESWSLPRRRSHVHSIQCPPAFWRNFWTNCCHLSPKCATDRYSRADCLCSGMPSSLQLSRSRVWIQKTLRVTGPSQTWLICRNSSNGWSADKSRHSWRETAFYRSINPVSVHATRLKLLSSRCCRTFWLRLTTEGWRCSGSLTCQQRLIRSTIKSCFTAWKVRLDWQEMYFRGWHRSWMAELSRSSSTAWPPSSPRCHLAFRREVSSVHSCSCYTLRISQS